MKEMTKEMICTVPSPVFEFERITKVIRCQQRLIKEFFVDKCVVLFVVSCILLGLISLVKLKGNESEVALEDEDVDLGLLLSNNVYLTQECREALANRDHCKETLIREGLLLCEQLGTYHWTNAQHKCLA
ncbi:hypothetical protein RHGRI_021462 [Rhododendron griersonianum]|uniref:Uncharacterized protein n=1 Tax=Rhododendron griersonianum TaxID=479676 RepID=A0AAV6JPX4_9ERIC|nr:hypothetical protein RHGRI_021462 [Rhododendron griersonianum]